MALLRYWINTSLDGFIADASGRFDWTEPDTELHAFFNEEERQLGTHLYGRRLYETMRYWETAHEQPDQPPVEADYGRVWRAADKVVYSRTLPAVDTQRTELVREFDAGDVARRTEASARDLSVGGAGLAAVALRAGLVDEVGLVEERRFSLGVVHLRYRVRSSTITA